MTATAFIFPGQGSQSVGMLAQLAESYPSILDVFTEASEVAGYDIWSLIQEGPASLLDTTAYTQVAMLTADVAIFRLLMAEGARMPQFMAGHSLGEYAALVCAGALKLKDAVALVALRGKLMQETVPTGFGAMAAIVGLEDAQVELICRQASTATELVDCANFNAIGQVVIAGHLPAVERACMLAEGAQARLAKIIPVSVPCHCKLLMPMAARFYDYLCTVTFTSPQIAVVSNVDLCLYQQVDAIRSNLQAQLYSPVRWVETIQLFKERGVQNLIECGPGKVLTGLVKRIDKSLTTYNIYDGASLADAMACAS